MSDLRPKGIPVIIGGQERKLLFTISVIDEIQEKCNAPLIDAIRHVVDVASGNTEKEHLTAFYAILTALLNRENKKEQESSDIDGLIQPLALAGTANKILEAFGVSMPDQEDNDDEDEEEDPNQVTGR